MRRLHSGIAHKLFFTQARGGVGNKWSAYFYHSYIFILCLVYKWCWWNIPAKIYLVTTLLVYILLIDIVNVYNMPVYINYATINAIMCMSLLCTRISCNASTLFVVTSHSLMTKLKKHYEKPVFFLAPRLYTNDIRYKLSNWWITQMKYLNTEFHY